MSEESNITIRLSKAAKEFNVGMGTILDFLAKKGFQVDSSPNTKLTSEMYALLVKEYQGEREVKNEAKKLGDLSYKGGSVSVDSAVQSLTSNREDEDNDEVIIRTSTIGIRKTVEKAQHTEPEKAHEPQEVEKKEPENKVVEKKEKTPVVEKHEEEKPQPKETEPEEGEGNLKVLGKIDLESLNTKTRPDKKTKEERQREAKEKAEREKAEKALAEQQKAERLKAEKQAAEELERKRLEEEKKKEQAASEPKFIKTEVQKLEGPKILDKIELPEERKRSKQQPVASSEGAGDSKKKKRKRIAGKPEGSSDAATENKGQGKGKGPKQVNTGDANKKNPKRDKNRPQPRHEEKVELSDEEISKQIKDTLARLSPLGKSKTSKHRREKRQQVAGSMMEEQLRQQEEQSVLKVTEFVTANDLAVMMNVPVTKVIATCMGLGMPVSINQRLDAEALSVVASEFGFQVDFVSADVQEAIAETEEVDREEDMVPRAPVVTVMGHVDHGKTKLLDYIRNTNVVAGEAGGITQHIGAYEVTTESGKKITFLDTPGHEAFTAMRARGAKITDVAIIVIATDDNVMPQTVEAINHAQAAGVPIVFALNKIDKPTAQPDRIREQLAKMNILVESWGGKYQEQEIAAKIGLNVDQLLEKVLLEAEFLDLKANPNKLAKGTVIESALDKGRGYVAKILVQNGTLHIGDMVLAGTTYGKVKAMFNDHNQKVESAGPSTPVLLLGLNGAPQPGDIFNVMTDEREVKDIANRREQLQREQTRRTNPHITLDEIGRRIAIGDFKELNIIVKADVDGSVEALADSLLKLSTEEV